MTILRPRMVWRFRVSIRYQIAAAMSLSRTCLVVKSSSKCWKLSDGSARPCALWPVMLPDRTPRSCLEVWASANLPISSTFAVLQRWPSPGDDKWRAVQSPWETNTAMNLEGDGSSPWNPEFEVHPSALGRCLLGSLFFETCNIDGRRGVLTLSRR